MKKKSIVWYALLVIVVAGIAAAFYGYNEFHRTAKNLSEETASFSLEQTDLINEFSSNEKMATQKFSGKVIEVMGTIKLIETDESGQYTIVLGDSSSLSSIRCSMDSSQLKTTLSPNTKTTIKGICTGFNADELGLGSDIILNRCVFVKP